MNAGNQLPKSANTHQKDIDAAIYAAMSAQSHTPDYAHALISLGEQISTVDGELAMRIFREACEISSALRHAQTLAKALVKLSWQHYLREEYGPALIRATHATKICTQNGLIAESMGAQYVLAHIHVVDDNLLCAEQQFCAIATLALERGDAMRRADYLQAQAYVKRINKDLDQALALSLEAYAIYQTHQDDQIDTCCNALARIYTLLEQHDQAIIWSKRALSHSNPARWRAHAGLLHTMGICCLNVDSVIDAGVYLFEADELVSGRDGSNGLRAEINLGLGRLHKTLNQHTAAIGYFETALTLAEGVKHLPLQRDLHQELDQLFSARQILDRANAHKRAIHSVDAASRAALEARQLALQSAKSALAELEPVWARNPLQRNYDI